MCYVKSCPSFNMCKEVVILTCDKSNKVTKLKKPVFVRLLNRLELNLWIVLHHQTITHCVVTSAIKSEYVEGETHR